MKKLLFVLICSTIIFSCSKTDSTKQTLFGFKYYVDNEEYSYPYTQEISVYNYYGSEHKIILGDIASSGAQVLTLMNKNQSTFNMGLNDSVKGSFTGTYNYNHTQIKSYGTFDGEVEIIEKYIEIEPNQNGIYNGYLKGKLKGKLDRWFREYPILNSVCDVNGEFTIPIANK